MYSNSIMESQENVNEKFDDLPKLTSKRIETAMALIDVNHPLHNLPLIKVFPFLNCFKSCLPKSVFNYTGH